jgi:hypothetical protein
MHLVIHNLTGSVEVKWANGLIIPVLLVTIQILGLTSVA